MAPSALHICLLSIHGLVRGHDQELGRDADTGGQVIYVVELARALAARENVARVDLVTRLIDDPATSEDYARAEESLGGGACILRIPCGPPGYIIKERLWDHLDAFADNLVDRYRDEGETPHLVHSHYADAGYVGTRVAHVFGLPLVHTGHSLGRVKRRRLLAGGATADEIQERYAMSRRVAAEERTLATAAAVITSTHQEIEEQYRLYDFYRPSAMHVIPPGTDLSRFQPPRGEERDSDIARAVERFLQAPDKPMILALSRADERKNISTLVHAYGQDASLRDRANLVIVVGNRDDLTELDKGARDVLTELLQLIDRYDLYGSVAYPKHHRSEDVPILYRLATLSGGVFVNPALTEPFGLTLIEAAASGLPIIATEDGGPRDIIANCDNGILVDPLDPAGIAEAIRTIIDDWEGWQRRSASGLRSVREHYVWSAHAERYLRMVLPLISDASVQAPAMPVPSANSPTYADRALFTDLNGGLLGDEEALEELLGIIRSKRRRFLFGIATGLRLDAALRMLRRHAIPAPDFLVTSTGTSITYGSNLREDETWSRHIERRWTPQDVRRTLAEAEVPGLSLRDRAQQSEFKISYQFDPDVAPPVEKIAALLYREDLAVNVVASHGRYLNIVPIRASKGLALRYLADRWHIPLERVLAIGGSAADESMLRGNTLAAIVGQQARAELALDESERLYFTEARAARGILEAMAHYDFLELPGSSDDPARRRDDAPVPGPDAPSGPEARSPAREDAPHAADEREAERASEPSEA